MYIKAYCVLTAYVNKVLVSILDTYLTSKFMYITVRLASIC